MTDGIAKENLRLFVDKGICIARGVVQLKSGCTSVLLTSFFNERRCFANNTTSAFIEEAATVPRLAALGTAPSEAVAADVVQLVEINPNFLESKRMI